MIVVLQRLQVRARRGVRAPRGRALGLRPRIRRPRDDRRRRARAAHPGASVRRSRGDRAARSRAPSVVELRDRPAVRARQRRASTSAAAAISHGARAAGSRGGSSSASSIGKPLGIVTTTALARRLRLGRLPEGVRLTHLVAAGAAAGIGFTVSLFVAEPVLRRRAPRRRQGRDPRRVGDRGVVGFTLLRVTGRQGRAPAASLGAIVAYSNCCMMQQCRTRCPTT